MRTAAFNAVAFAILAAVPAVHAQSGGPYDMAWSTIDGGGWMSSAGGPYSIAGTIGQADAGVECTAAGLVLRPGFWAGVSRPCPADWDGSGAVDPADVSAFIRGWYQCLAAGSLAADFDGSGAVAPADIAVFVSAWSAAVAGGC